jgi:hypothetical protein
MAVIENQQSGLSTLIKINGERITEGSRSTQIETLQSGSDVELARGVVKRYVKKNKKKFSISFTYLPNTHEKTVDGCKGRDYLSSISQTRGTVTVTIKLDPLSGYEDYTCYVNSYSEKLIRRDIPEACNYYDVSIEFEEQ